MMSDLSDTPAFVAGSSRGVARGIAAVFPQRLKLP
jgi:hypothetical protein